MGRKMNSDATFKDYVKLVEAGVGRALDKAADWEEGGTSFGGTAFGGSTIGTTGTNAGPESITPYYKDDAGRALIPHELKPEYEIEYSMTSDTSPDGEWRSGKLGSRVNNEVWDVIDRETGDRRQLNLLNMRGPAKKLGYQNESIDRMKELAGIPESASGGATGAGGIASAPVALGSEMIKRSKPKPKKKRKEVKPPSNGVSMLGHIQDPTPNVSKLSGKMRKKRKSREGKRERAKNKSS